MWSAGHYRHDRRFQRTECHGCDGEEQEGEKTVVVEEQEHVASRCKEYADLQELYDLNMELHRQCFIGGTRRKTEQAELF